MEMFQLALLLVIGFIIIYMLLDRVCKCCENCAMFKAYGKAVDINKIKETKPNE